MKKTDYSVVIVGSGISGLYAALKIVEGGNKKVLLVTKSQLGESNSRYAQGGIVGVLPENQYDSTELHVKDTLRAGAGLTNPDVAEEISEKSDYVIKDLIKFGVEFDKDEQNDLSMTLEGAHSVKRILHAGGDATGQSIESALVSKVSNNPNIDIYERTIAVDLLVDSNRECRGLILLNTDNDNYEAVFAQSVIIATGGIGQVYSNTTNPKIATGDGIAIAYRSNAVVQDMEFVQFHPTALAVETEDTRFLISEAVRGEGAKLKNKYDEFFVQNYHELAELAPRDEVARAIYSETQKLGCNYVYLDATIIDSERLKKRFPTIGAACKDQGIDICKDYIPVSPAAHYSMGGIKTSVDGTTSIKSLYAIGEASCTGLHGANRLASNSLLECVVSSAEVAKKVLALDEERQESDSKIDALIQYYSSEIESIECNFDELSKRLKETMWENAGIVRTQESLTKALEDINEIKSIFNRQYKCISLEEYELRNMLTIAELIVQAALARKESRGAHYREDYKKTQSTAYHSLIKKGEMLSKNAVSFA